MKVRSIHVELTNRCNLRCPMCFQKSITGPKIDLDLSIFDKIPMENIVYIDLCGNVSEPTCHPYIFDFIDLTEEKTKIKISTNGSTHNEVWWEELAKKLDKHTDCSVWFALDGLEESHKKYRIGTNYKQLLKNIKSFNEAGGTSFSQFIMFKHNQDDIKKVEKLSKELGCEGHFIRTSSSYNDVLERPTIKKIETRHEMCENKEFTVECMHLDKQSLFIEHSGEIFPCCFLGGCKYKNKYRYELYEKHKGDINLYDHTLEEILNSKYYKYIYKNYQNIELCQTFCRHTWEKFMEKK